MAEILKLPSYREKNKVEISQVDADAVSGQAVVTIKNPQGILVNDFLVVGRPSSEQAELKKVLSISGKDITLVTNLEFSHSRFEEVTKLFGEKIKVQRAPNVDGSVPDDSAFASIVTLSIEADQLEVRHNDPTGGSGFWYKWTYFNSVNTKKTDLADIKAFRGGDAGHYVTLEQARKEAGFSGNLEVTDYDIREARNSAESEVKGALHVGGYNMPVSDNPLDVPSILASATRILAASYLLLKSYGAGFEGTNEDGRAKREIAMDMLKSIKRGEVQVLDIKEESVGKTSGVGGWPDDKTKDASSEDAGGKRKFRITDKY